MNGGQGTGDSCREARSVGRSPRLAVFSSSLSPIPFPVSPSSGFTLIEVLAALIIVSLGMLGVIQAVGQTASNSSYLRDKTLAHWVAMNRLTEARLQQQIPKVDKTSDEVEMAGRRWRWTMVVTQTEVESMRRIDVSVRPAEADDGSSMASVTGFFGAAVAPPGSTLISWQGAERRGGRGRDRDDEQPGRGGKQPSTDEPEPGERVDEPIVSPQEQVE